MQAVSNRNTLLISKIPFNSGTRFNGRGMIISKEHIVQACIKQQLITDLTLPLGECLNCLSGAFTINEHFQCSIWRLPVMLEVIEIYLIEDNSSTFCISCIKLMVKCRTKRNLLCN